MDVTVRLWDVRTWQVLREARCMDLTVAVEVLQMYLERLVERGGYRIEESAPHWVALSHPENGHLLIEVLD